MLCGALLDLSENVLNRGLLELIRIVLHILLSVFICRHKHEDESNKRNSSAKSEIAFSVIVTSLWIDLFLALHEAASNTARVLVANLVDLDSVVSAEERDHEVTGLIIRLSADQFSIKSEHVHVLFEHFFHVNLGGLRSQRVNRAKGVLG